MLRTLWLPGRPSSLIHLTRGGAIERTHRGVRLHGSRLPEEFVEDLDGMPVTTVARTAVDLARGLNLPDAMTVIDSAARLLIQRASGEDLRVLRSVSRRAELLPLALAPLTEAFASVWTWPGTVVVRGAIELVDPASESPYESRSRGWMYEAKLPMPLTAYEVQGASGVWYVSEFAWERERVLGEVDGIEKYGRTGAEVATAVLGPSAFVRPTWRTPAGPSRAGRRPSAATSYSGASPAPSGSDASYCPKWGNAAVHNPTLGSNSKN